MKKMKSSTVNVGYDIVHKVDINKTRIVGGKSKLCYYCY